MLRPSACLVFLLWLAGPTASSNPDFTLWKSRLEGRLKTEARTQSALKDKDGDRISNLRSSPVEIGDAPASKTASIGEDGAAWTELGTTAKFRSTLSIRDGGLWESRTPSRCVPIPSDMALCQNIGYDTMRMPNLLGHESLAEAVQQSTSWLPLLARECHPDARSFLCSLFAPICLDR